LPGTGSNNSNIMSFWGCYEKRFSEGGAFRPSRELFLLLKALLLCV
jgi:hypothetical protein